MIIKESDVLKKLNHPMNLFNNKTEKKSNNKGLSIFIKPSVANTELANSTPTQNNFNPFTEKKHDAVVPVIESKEPNTAPSIDELSPESNYDIKLQEAHNKAIDVLTNSLEQLSVKVPELGAKQLADTAAKAMRVVESIRKEKLEREKVNKGEGEAIHFHFYNPKSRSISDFNIIEVEATPGVQ